MLIRVGDDVGFPLFDICHLIWQLRYGHNEVDVIAYLKNHNIIDLNGKVIDERYGMTNVTENSTDAYSKTSKEYILVSIEGAKQLIKELVYESHD